MDDKEIRQHLWDLEQRIGDAQRRMRQQLGPLQSVAELPHTVIDARTGRAATIVVAASDSSSTSKRQADYVCDSVADNVEIQAAIDALPTTGGSVVLLEGTYTLAAPLYWSKSGVTLQGVSGWGTRLNNSALGRFDGYINGTPTNTSIPYDDGAGGNPASEANLLVNMVCLNLTKDPIEWVHITGFDTAANTIAVEAASPHNASGWSNNDQIRCMAPAIYVHGETSHVERTLLENFLVTSGANALGVFLEQLNRSNIVRNVRINASGMDGLFASGARFLLLDTVECVENGRDGIRITAPASNNTSNANLIMNCRTQGNTDYGINSDGAFGYNEDNAIIGGSCEGNTAGGLRLWRNTIGLVLSVHFEANSNQDILVDAVSPHTSVAALLGNYLRSACAWGIVVGRGRYVTIDHNQSVFHTSGGISISADANDTHIGNGNQLQDANPITDLGTNTRNWYGMAPIHGAAYHTDRTRNIWLPAQAFDITSGTPTLGTIGAGNGYDDAATWDFPDASNNYIGTTFLIPEDWASGSVTFKAYLAMATATSGVLVLRLNVSFVADGESLISAGTNYNPTWAVPGTATTLFIADRGPLSGIAAGDIIRLGFGRQGTHASDTATGNMQLLGVELEYLADS